MNGIAVSTSPLRLLCSPPCNALKINNFSLQEIPPNALLRKRDSSWRGGFSLGVDLGMSRTGLALSKGFSIRPLKVFDEFTFTYSCEYLYISMHLAFVCVFICIGFLCGAYVFRFLS